MFRPRTHPNHRSETEGARRPVETSVGPLSATERHGLKLLAGRDGLGSSPFITKKEFSYSVILFVCFNDPFGHHPE